MGGSPTPVKSLGSSKRARLRVVFAVKRMPSRRKDGWIGLPGWLNVAEAQGARDGNGRARFRTALGSTRETRAALRLAVAWGYAPDDDALLDALDRIAATLHKLGR